ncbi:MAG: hypothetical protein WC356_01375 [Candidatus Micrarchaeia archaeon]|jgi:hypothetical protein
MFSWNKEIEEILEKYTSYSINNGNLTELEIEKLKLNLLLKTIENSKTLIETEERSKQIQQKIHDLSYAFAFASLKDRKKRIKTRIEKTEEFIERINNTSTKGEFYEELVKQAKERIEQYKKIEGIPTIERNIVESVLKKQIENKVSQTKKQIIKNAITAPLRPGKEVRVLLDKKTLTIINEKTKIQYETENANKEIEEIFKIRNLFGVSLNELYSPLVIDIKKQEDNIKMDITEKIFEGNKIKTKNHSVLFEA